MTPKDPTPEALAKAKESLMRLYRADLLGRASISFDAIPVLARALDEFREQGRRVDSEPGAGR